MKIITIVWLVLATLLVVLDQAAHYWLGYSELPMAFALTNRLFGLMAEVALFLLFIIPALWSELTRKQRLWSYIGLLGFWPLVIGTFYLAQVITPAGGLIAQGLRDRTMHVFSLDDLRHFAKEVNEAGFLKDLDLVNELDTTGLNAQQKALFAQLQTKYPFMLWLDDDDLLRGASLLNYGQEGIVNFEWGAPNRGRWGCSISVNGAKNETIPFPDETVLRVSDDIYFYYHPLS